MNRLEIQEEGEGGRKIIKIEGRRAKADSIGGVATPYTAVHLDR